MRNVIVGALLLVLGGGAAVAQDSESPFENPWRVAPVLDGPGLCAWMPIGERDGAVRYADALLNAAAILKANKDAPRATVIVIYGDVYETLEEGGWKGGDGATLTVDGKRLAKVPNPIPLRGEREGEVSLAFEALPKGCDAFELTIPQAKGPLVLRVRRLSRRIQDAQQHLKAWIEHANSDELRVVSAIQPYLDCDGYRAFAKADEKVRAALCIQELARGDREDGLARFLAWHALERTYWGEQNLEGVVGDDAGVQRALAIWSERGVRGVPAEHPGSSAR